VNRRETALLYLALFILGFLVVGFSDLVVEYGFFNAVAATLFSVFIMWFLPIRVFIFGANRIRVFVKNHRKVEPLEKT